MSLVSATFPRLPESDVHVTRHFSLTGETNRHFLSHSENETLSFLQQEQGTFCDWLSLYQHHGQGQGLPLVNDGAFVRYDAHGVHESTTLKKLRVEGSHETALFVRCDGETVWFEGNVSKFGRPDNVFGFTLGQCIERINAFLHTLGLPPFTSGVRSVDQRVGDSKTGDWRPTWTGARITRIDITQNFAAGSRDNAYAFMRHLASQQASRLKTGTHGEGETVDFGRGSRRVYSKAYLKGPELFKHIGNPNKFKKQTTQFSKPHDPYIIELAQWCSDIGLVRFETTYKSTYLIDAGLNYLGGFDMNVIHVDFQKRQEVFTRATCEADQLSDLPKQFLATYRMWQAGDDVAKHLSRPTFYRHRAALLPYGVDIAIKSNVVRLAQPTKIITLGPVAPPDFYRMPSPSFISLAA